MGESIGEMQWDIGDVGGLLCT